MYKFRLCVSLAAILLVGSLLQGETRAKDAVFSVPQYLQDISVTVHAGRYSGSGVMVTTKDGSVFVWTAAHVLEDLRTTRTVLSSDGKKKIVTEFEDAKVVKFLREGGRKVGESRLDAEVIRYSDSWQGHDLALLRLRTKKFKPAASAKFFLENDLPPIGADLYHCGSLLGSFGSNSLTSGIISQHGRIIRGKIFDQATCPSFPGSSGGIVCLKRDGRYVGMLVMGAGETFDLIVPVRRMRSWAREVGVEFAMDPSIAVPSDKELRSKPVENKATDKLFSEGGRGFRDFSKPGLRYMIIDRSKIPRKFTVPIHGSVFPELIPAPLSKN